MLVVPLRDFSLRPPAWTDEGALNGEGSRAALRQWLTDRRLTQIPSVYGGLTPPPAGPGGRFRSPQRDRQRDSASLLGKPDVGLVSLAETVAVARNLAAAFDIPLLVDADTG